MKVSKPKLYVAISLRCANGFAFKLQGYGECNKRQTSKLPTNSKQRIAEPVSLNRLLACKAIIALRFMLVVYIIP
jgi:hypothetical protein